MFSEAIEQQFADVVFYLWATFYKKNYIYHNTYNANFHSFMFLFNP